MRTFSKQDLELFKQICKLDQEDLLKLVAAFLYKHYDRVEATYDYIFAEGDIPVALVAHLDTVFMTPPTEIYYDKEAGVMWSPQGLGADDRAGIFAIIKIIQSGLKPHIIITTDEEYGGLGARWLIYDYPECPFKECHYLLELDRQGTNDACFYDCGNEEFIEFIEQAGFCETLGIYSDICELSPKWDIASVNVSVGYFDEHSAIERLRVPVLLQTIKSVQKLLSKPVNKTFEYKEKEFSYGERLFSKGLCGKPN